jgi:dihydrofolate reductase
MIAAVGNDFAIGYQNQLLCHLPKDLIRFKTITTGYPVIMGDKTWDSLPKKPLPKRRNIVMTLDPDFQADGCEIAHSVEEAMALTAHEEKVFVIGGGTIYRIFMPLAHELYITRIYEDFQADAFFPGIREEEWNLVENIVDKKDENNKYDLYYQTFVRK